VIKRPIGPAERQQIEQMISKMATVGLRTMGFLIFIYLFIYLFIYFI
jgi:hypothetical protein